MCKKLKYDLVFSLGAACSCTQVLRRRNLQLASYPLDWLFGSDFSGRIELLANDFTDFINKEDLEYTFSERSISCDAYYNKSNDLTFNHDFPTGVDLNESYDIVRAKYNRRIERLLQNIKDARKILIAYIETPDASKHADNDDIIKGVEKIRAKYPDKQIDFICLISDGTMQPKKYKTEILQRGGVIKITGNYGRNKKGKPSYTIDMRFVSSIFKKYRLNMPLNLRIKRYLAKTFAKLCPIRSIKDKIRKKYHV